MTTLHDRSKYDGKTKMTTRCDTCRIRGYAISHFLTSTMKLFCSAALAIGVAATTKHDDDSHQPSVRGGRVSGADRSEAIDMTAKAVPTAINDPTARQLQPTYCSCSTCTQSTWDTYAGAYQCGARIEWKSSQWGGNLSHEDACRFVSNEFPTICGPACHPDLCEATDPPTLAPVVQPPKCGCESCTAEVWSHPAGGSYPCGDRIEYKMSQWGGNLSEEDACRFVSNEFPNNECGPFCNPDLCNLTPEPSPTPTTAEPTSTPTKSPTDNPTKTPTDNPTPAPTRMPTDNPTPAPITADPTSSPVVPEPKYCGCHDCTDTVWSTMAGAYPCGDRITYMKSQWGGNLPEDEACAFVSAEFPSICGPYCDPSTCDGRCPLYAEPYTAPIDTPSTTSLKIQDPLYCFPDYNQRERYTNTFGGTYVIEAKDGQGGPCGPGDNAFTSDTVSYDATTQELILEYKKIGSAWKASEVRLLKSDTDPTFGYGTFTFSIKSVSVYDESNNVVSTALPSDLVLGLFTWDTTEDYASHENWNHEVDVEISQWGDLSQTKDVQFLTQPHHPGGPHFPERLSSGGESATSSADFDQGDHTYGFTWEPNEITWYTTAGGGQSRVYSTQIAKDACSEDYIQCLPANVEIRLNLWDMNGSSDSFAPSVAGLTDGTRVEVVIDDFDFTPSSTDHVPNGEGCTKHCQCGPNSICGTSGTCEPSA